MSKQEFLLLLKKRLLKLPKKEVKERILFYSEMIDDRIEEGLSEEEAVSEIGNIDDVANQIILESSNEEESTRKQHNIWGIVLLVIGSPVWAPLLVAGLIIIWSLLIVLWAIEIPFLIFSFISKYLLIVCKKTSIWIFKLTKICFKKMGNIFNS